MVHATETQNPARAELKKEAPLFSSAFYVAAPRRGYESLAGGPGRNRAHTRPQAQCLPASAPPRTVVRPPDTLATAKALPPLRVVPGDSVRWAISRYRGL